MASKKVVIYTRFSSDQQREESCDDQEREVRKGLERLGIDHSSALVLKDKAESGTKTDREEFQELLGMIEREEIQVLAVDDQSRLTRAENAFGLVKNLVFTGGRFAATAEGIDTDREGWETMVQVKEIANSATNRDHGKRVHRGQEGRIRDDCGSAGDLAYGFTSEHIDPHWAERPARGPRPKKRVVIFEEEAQIVRQVFQWFVEGMSIRKIANELTCRKISKGRKSSKRDGPWHHPQVRRMLESQKYIGQWPWGKTRIVRNSNGKVRQKPVDPALIVHRDRPSLRIIDQDLWERVQQRLRRLAETYGTKEGQKQRGPRRHYSKDYPKSLLSGVLYCGKCGSRLVQQSGGTDNWYGCPRHRSGLCDQTKRVGKRMAENALVELVCRQLTAETAWIEKAHAVLIQHLELLRARVPTELDSLQRQRDTLCREIANLTQAIAQNGLQSPTLVSAVRDRETKLDDVNAQLSEIERTARQSRAIPSLGEVREQLEDLAGILRAGQLRATQVMHKILGKVEAHEILAMGKSAKHGFIRLKLRLNRIAAVREVCPIPGTPPELASEEIVLDLGAPTRVDAQMPTIIAMRNEGKSWRTIGEETGLGCGNALQGLRCRERHLNSQEAAR